MIDIKLLKEADKGRLVVFLDDSENKEVGRIVEWDEDSIFVDYGNSTIPYVLPTNPINLSFMEET